MAQIRNILFLYAFGMNRGAWYFVFPYLYFGMPVTIVFMDDEKILYKDLSYKIVGLAMQVHTELGPGFLEKVYENALMVLFEENGISAQAYMPIKVSFHGRIIGDYIADIVVENSIILELKAQDRIVEIHKAQTLNYLRATGFRLALLINFGKDRLDYHRIIL